jgi:hypothetical protein
MSEPRSGRGNWPWWAAVAAAGAGGLVAGYLLDPELGRGRRLRLAAHSAHLMRRAAMHLGREATYLRTSTYRRTRHWLRPLPPAPAQGSALLDRVESELFANPRIPRGQLNLEVEDTVVVLRGQLDSQATIEEVEGSVTRIPGVSDVKSLLHLKGTPAPNKVASLRASERALAAGWPQEPPPDVDSES